MNMPLPTREDDEMVDDLSTLAWVHEELRRSLEAAHKSLRRYLKEAEARSGSDVDAVDPAVLRSARAQVHQGVGALEMVGLSGPARVLRASETALQRLIAKPRLVNAAVVETLESASFGVLDYLGRKLAGKGLPSLALFPQYRALLELGGADRVHPADLWRDEWHWRELPPDRSAPPLSADLSLRSAMETHVLALMRAPDRAAMTSMSDLCAGLGAASSGHLAGLWQLAAAFFEAQAAGLLQPDVYAKRVSSRLLAQLRMSIAGQNDVSYRLAQDVLFFCAHARPPSDNHPATRLGSVRDVYELDGAAAFDYQTLRLGRFDPALIAQARKRVGGAKEVWSAVAGGELHRLSGLAEQFALVGDSLRRLYASGELLAEALQRAVNQTLAALAPPPAALAMEVATSVLYLDASLEDGEFDHLLVGERVKKLARRIELACDGRDAQPLDPWMEELYRRVSDRQTMGSVVQELRASLSDVEKQIDQYFRDPTQRELLIPVPAQLQSMRGVLSVLDLEQASHAVMRMSDDVDALAATEVDPQRAAGAGTFDRLADNLGALSFLIDMLSVQPQMARALFSFDAETGQLKSAMGRRGHRLTGFGGFDDSASAAPVPLVEQAQSLAAAGIAHEDLQEDLKRLSQQAMLADQRGLAETIGSAQAKLQRATDDAQRQAVREELAQAVAGFSEPVPARVVVEQQPVRHTPAAQPAVQGSTGLEDDAEMREIFVEEAREVLQGAREALQRLAEIDDDLGDLTLIRRAFHTLKGSSRMVGLNAFGEAAWACEQLYNARLADNASLDVRVGDFTGRAVDYLGAWVEAIADGRDEGHGPGVISAEADALRTNESTGAAMLHAPAAAAVPAATLLGLVPNLPSADDLDLDFDLVIDPAAAETQTPSQPASSDATRPAMFDQPHVEEIELDLGEGSPASRFEAADQGLDATVTLPVLPPLDILALDAGHKPWSEHVSLEMPALSDDVSSAPAADDFELDLDDASAMQHDEHVVPAETDAPRIDDLSTTVPQPSQAPADEASATVELHGGLEAASADPVPAGDAFADAASETAAAAAAAAEESVKVIGDLRIGIPLFNIYVSEADELSRRLCTELSEWAMQPEQPLGDNAPSLAHSLAGSSATVGYAQLSTLARALEHAMLRSIAVGTAGPGEAQLFNDVADEIRYLLHQFAAGFLKSPSDDVLRRIEQHELDLAEPSVWASDAATIDGEDTLPDEVEPSAFDAALHLQGSVATELGQLSVTSLAKLPQTRAAEPRARADALDDEDDIDAVDVIDDQLFPIFQEEGEELLPQLQSRMRDWVRRPSEMSAAAACMRTLHTFKGGARLAGAMRLGEMAHRLETAIEHLLARGQANAGDVEGLLARVDVIANTFDQLGQPGAAGDADAATAAMATLAPAMAQDRRSVDVAQTPSASADTADGGAPQALPVHAPADAAFTAADADIDWTRFSTGAVAALPLADRPATSIAAVRVRAPLLDRLVNHAGEVSITRSRIESNVGQIKGSLVDLSDNLERLRRQLRDLELQAESQISSRMEAAKASAQGFDPLEMDRFTRFQELTRMMAESVNDVATVQRGLQRSLQATEDELAAQARLTRDLQDDLLRTRMVEFEGLADRLYRVVRQAAKETGKQVRLDIVGGSIEVDRGVLDRMTAPFEHLLRNSVAHGIESPQQRVAAGKDATGTIRIDLTHEGNEVAVEVRDDGAGLNLARIRERAEAQGLIQRGAEVADADLAQLIFAAGFSTADGVSELSGRGVGMDVVRAEVNAMGGRIETATAAGAGASFRLVLPLTTAVTQVVMLRCGKLSIAVPSTLVEVVRRVPNDQIEAAYASGHLSVGDSALPFFWLGALLQMPGRAAPTGRAMPVVVIRSASQRVALHVDEVLGNQEVVVKNLGPQLARLPGLAGVTLLPSGSVALIYNPVALATLYGDAARVQLQQPGDNAPRADAVTEPLAPLVLVVDDSLTVRRVTQRMLLREGYRVTLAKDGLDALEKLAQELPAVVLSDIEMPRMDGFDLVRNMRSDAKLTQLPVIMITSRIAQKHRDYAAELGVDHYLGKPYSEEELLGLVGQYARAAALH